MKRGLAMDYYYEQKGDEQIKEIHVIWADKADTKDKTKQTRPVHVQTYSVCKGEGSIQIQFKKKVRGQEGNTFPWVNFYPQAFYVTSGKRTNTSMYGVYMQRGRTLEIFSDEFEHNPNPNPRTKYQEDHINKNPYGINPKQPEMSNNNNMKSVEYFTYYDDPGTYYIDMSKSKPKGMDKDSTGKKDNTGATGDQGGAQVLSGGGDVAEMNDLRAWRRGIEAAEARGGGVRQLAERRRYNAALRALAAA